MIDKQQVKLQVWDTAGQERFRTITQSYYKSANGIILAYDCTNQKSFDNVQTWLSQIENNANPGVLVMLIATKSDMVDQMQVAPEQGRTFAEEHKLCFFETSSKTGVNVEESFLTMAKAVKDQLNGVDPKSSSSSDPRKEVVKGGANNGLTVPENKSLSRK